MKKTVIAIVTLAALTLSVVMASAQTIKVGAILAVTGGASFLGLPEERTLRMLVDEINAQGGIKGKKLELIVRDSGGSPERAVSFARQLIEEQRVFAIIGPSTSGETMRIKQIAEEGKTIMLSLAAAEAIVNPLARYVFKTPQNDRFAAQRIFMTMNDLGIKRIAVVSGNDGFGQAGRGQLEQIAPDYGLEIVANEVYDSRATDLSALVAKLRSHNQIEAVINWSVVPAQAILVRNMRQAGWEVPLFQSHGFGNIRYVEVAGAAAEGIIFPAGRLLIADVLEESHPQKEILVKYQNDYESKFNEPASTFGGHAYDALMILARAIEEVGADREKVRDAIENMRDFVGTGGIFNFSPTDHNGLDLNAFEMLTVKDGQFVKYDR
ncbi:MAG TPA: ABC transporter substrate-binding protein [Desulfurivibrio alkaliphilus]|uniref:ABC transporter substrate-binding protein n=1 Tax=Desulfurivibrio alkaliphilus TaxID=427923 RepID=A0A7C2THE7_9BACT|nr:ABC transporter substrate-binding protein [Desulfurivibrio alkaliphilus]